ncbi:MAG: DNA polymerase III subunit epsilon [Gammaproteobacteria bacterium TMED119]|nr:MAG: DNA polymerase III subunit epsilon [Gammaproteobacteria bacterium TMED119]
MRQVVLDTETTGLEVSDEHRVIEIGAVEIINRSVTDRFYHQYLNPERAIDVGAQEVHGISIESLQDKPLFADVCEEFLDFVKDSNLVIHNAAFDVGFLDHELHCVGHAIKNIKQICTVTDSLYEARKMHPGQRNSLDALCKRYDIDNTHRELHGALLDAQILADVYLAMTGGQVDLTLGSELSAHAHSRSATNQLTAKVHQLKVVHATAEELAEHEKLLKKISDSAGDALWQREHNKH